MQAPPRIQRNKLMIRLLPKNELQELSMKAEADGLALSDIAATCVKFDVAPQDVLNELSIAIAEGYSNDQRGACAIKHP